MPLTKPNPALLTFLAEFQRKRPREGFTCNDKIYLEAGKWFRDSPQSPIQVNTLSREGGATGQLT